MAHTAKASSSPATISGQRFVFIWMSAQAAGRHADWRGIVAIPRSGMSRLLASPRFSAQPMISLALPDEALTPLTIVFKKAERSGLTARAAL